MLKNNANRQPTIGLIIGSYAAMPYVHLHLESWRRFYPNIPVLVHDDHSPQGEELGQLCDDYKVSFTQSSCHWGHQAGDLAAYAAGLQWAYEQHLDIVVKMSQRFIPLLNWVPELQRLGRSTPGSTYTDRCHDYGFPFRSECAALRVSTWYPFLEKIEACVTQQDFGIVEWFMYNLCHEIRAREAANPPNQAVQLEAAAQPVYWIWPLLGGNSLIQQSSHLWHRAYDPPYYFSLAQEYGLQQYTLENFTVPSAANYTPNCRGVAQPLLPHWLINVCYRVARSTPSDLNEHIDLIAYLASLCCHVTEFASQSGNATVALIYGGPQRVCCYDLNSATHLQLLQAAATQAGVEFSLQQADVLNLDIAPTDLLFIDSIHTYEQAQGELKLHAGKVRRFIVFHDTATFGECSPGGQPGIWPAIEEFLDEHPEWKIFAHLNNNNGLTILFRPSPS